MIETELGSVDLGIRSQLGEIERGFFDRAGGRRTEHAIAAKEARAAAGDAIVTSLPETPSRPLLGRYFAKLHRGQPWRWRGQVLESVDRRLNPPALASVGECCEIQDQFGCPHLAEVIGFRGSNVLSMPVETTEGFVLATR